MSKKIIKVDLDKIDNIADLTLKEAVDLSDYLKETYGIEAAAGGAVMVAGGLSAHAQPIGLSKEGVIGAIVSALIESKRQLGMEVELKSWSRSLLGDRVVDTIASDVNDNSQAYSQGAEELLENLESLVAQLEQVNVKIEKLSDSFQSGIAKGGG